MEALMCERWMQALCAALLAAGAVGWLALYFRVRRYAAQSKWSVEILFVGLPILVSCLANALVYYCVQTPNTSPLGTIANVFRAAFNGFGHLTLNGLAELDATAWRAFLAYFYYGSALYTALVFFTVLTAKANYEFYSFVRMAFAFKRNKNVYVFTALNTETLTLAKSVAECVPAAIPQTKREATLSLRARRKHKRNSIVVFAIPSLKPFDRHDELCREVMANGFYYWSYAGDAQATKKTIANTLHLNNRNYRKDCARDYCIFAFDSVDYIPKEEQNFATVFDDIGCRMSADRFDHIRVNYYILTKRQMQYSVYDYKLRELQSRYYEELHRLRRAHPAAYRRYMRAVLGEEKAEKFDACLQRTACLTDYALSSRAEQKAMTAANAAGGEEEAYSCLLGVFAAGFVIDVWDEANTIAKDVLDKSTDLIYDKITADEPDLNVMSLGFGETGIAAAMALYSHAAYVAYRDDGAVAPYDLPADGEEYRYAQLAKANAFHVDVFDVNAQNIGYGFASERPLCAVSIVQGDRVTVVNDANGINERLIERYDKNPNAHTAGFGDRLASEMKYPELVFHDEDCQKRTYLRAFERDGELRRPDVVVIAAGDDYADVSMANAIIQRIVNDAVLYPQRRVDIFVNVWDNNNNDLIISGGGRWNADHRVLTFDDKSGRRYMTVYVVGNNETIYCYQNTVDVRREAEFNYRYDGLNLLAVEKDGDEGFARAFPNAMQYPYTIDLVSEEYVRDMAKWICIFIAKAKEYEAKAGDLAPRRKYDLLDPWRKESNAMAQRNADLYRRLLDYWQVPDNLATADSELLRRSLRRYAQLSCIEHQRWVRLHAAHGWLYRYAANKYELESHHNCLLPYADVDRSAILYDLGNVLLSWVYGASKNGPTD